MLGVLSLGSSLMSEMDAVGSTTSILGGVKAEEIGSLPGRHGQSFATQKGALIDNAHANKVVSVEELRTSAATAQSVVNAKMPQSLAFTVEEETGRFIVVVTEVGSDKIIRQFPPEEFLTVAKVLASLGKDGVSREMLKGILYDSNS